MDDEEKSLEESLVELAALRDAWLIPPCRKCGRGKKCSGMSTGRNFCPRLRVWFSKAWNNVRNEILES